MAFFGGLAWEPLQGGIWIFRVGGAGVEGMNRNWRTSLDGEIPGRNEFLGG